MNTCLCPVGVNMPLCSKSAYGSLLSVLMLTFFFLTGSDTIAQSRYIYTTSNTPVYMNGTVSGNEQQIRLKSFSVTRKEGNQVWLSWTTEQEGQTSHFVIERSANGVDYEEAGLFFTAENVDANNYLFKDTVRKKTEGTVYYRLRIVDMDGAALYSAVQFLPVAK